MTKTYKINFRHQFNSFKTGAILLALIPIVPLLVYVTGKATINDYRESLVVVLLFNLVFFLPAFYLHISYYLHNRNTILTVDSQAKRFSIKTKNNSEDFTFEDIHLAEQHLSIYHKNKIDHRRRFITPWIDYGYFKLKLNNGQTFFFSSIMMDVQNPLFSSSNVNYRFIPYIDKSESTIQEKRERIEEEQNEKYHDYLNKFADVSHAKLEEKIENASQYEPEAIAAAKTILENMSSKDEYQK
ncbi:MAG: hypothetical protein RL204_1489 [Bacteroidota bacterium]|jgi:hypothetical protein